MELHLSPDAERFIEAQVQRGIHGSAAEVIDALVQEHRAAEATSAPVPPAVEQPKLILQVIRECETILLGAPERPVHQS